MVYVVATLVKQNVNTEVMKQMHTPCTGLEGVLYDRCSQIKAMV